MARTKDINARGRSASSAASAAGTRDRLHAIYQVLEREYGRGREDGEIPWEWYRDHPWYSELKVLVSAVLVQHASWSAAKPVAEKLVRRGLAGILALAPDDLQKMLEESGLPTRKAATLRALAESVQAGGGLRAFLSLPKQDLGAALLGVKGIGDETAAAIMLYAADQPVFVVDEYAYRLFRRLAMGPAVDDGTDWRKNYGAWQTYFADGLGENVELFQRFHAHIVRHCQPPGDSHKAGPCLPASPMCVSCPLLDSCPSGLRRNPVAALGLKATGDTAAAVLNVIDETRRDTIRAMTLAGRANRSIAEAVQLAPTEVRRIHRKLLPVGDNEVIRADSLQAMRWMAPESIDAVVTDPPYALDIDDEWDRFRGDDYLRFSVGWLRGAFRALKPGGYVATFCSTLGYRTIWEAARVSGFEVVHVCVWWRHPDQRRLGILDKMLDAYLGRPRDVRDRRPGHAFGSGQEQARNGTMVTHTAPGSWESAQWEGRKIGRGVFIEPVVLLRKPRVLTGRRGGAKSPDHVARHFLPYSDEPDFCVARRADDREKTCGGAVPEAREHRTVKPVAVMSWLCKLVTPSGGLILDPFMGSGTTALAAKSGGYRYLGVERNPLYAHVARERARLWRPEYDRNSLTPSGRDPAAKKSASRRAKRPGDRERAA